MRNFMRKVAPIVLLLLILCACTPGQETTGTTTTAPSKSDVLSGRTVELTVSIADKIAQSEAVSILYREEEIYTSSDRNEIQAFAEAFAQWDPKENKTECMDTDCAVAVIFDGVRINCNVTGDRYGVIFLSEPSYYNLPQAFLDLVGEYVEKKTVDIADVISRSETVSVLYREEEIYTSSDQNEIQAFAEAFAQWDPKENKTECMDTDCAVAVIFDGVRINCNVTGDRYGVIFLSEPSYYNLPQAFLDLVGEYVECHT